MRKTDLAHLKGRVSAVYDTYKELAEELRVSQAHLSGVLNGKHKGQRLIERINEAVECRERQIRKMF